MQEQTPRPFTESQFNVVISEDGQTRSLYAEGHTSSMNIDLKKQPTSYDKSPKILKQAVPLTHTNSIKYGGESKTTILLNQQSNRQLPESGAASSAASSPFLRASLHDVLSQTESPIDSPRMSAAAATNTVTQQCVQVQTEAPPAHLGGESSKDLYSVPTHSDSFINVLSAAQIKEFIDTFRAKTSSSLQKDPLFRSSSNLRRTSPGQEDNTNCLQWLPVCPKCAIFFSSFI